MNNYVEQQTFGGQLQKFVRPSPGDLVEARIRRSARLVVTIMEEADWVDDEVTARTDRKPWLRALGDQAEIEWASNSLGLLGRFSRGEQPWVY